MKDPWDYYRKFDDITDTYMPLQGQGDSMASQIVTAVNKLIYKWYNDGDVYDNTHGMEGWANDLSSYANWLYKNVKGSRGILDQIEDCYNDSDYEDLLADLAEYLLDPKLIEDYKDKEAVGTIYDCNGPYEFKEYEFEDEEDEYEDEGGYY